ncbi:MAG: DUF3054 family protein [Anaerolineae bacterium]|nr:DUF3054 family protein [Anaerolineae bacterium]
MKLTKSQTILIAGDVLVLIVITLVGFQFHKTLGSAGTRILTTLLPWLAGWLLLFPHLRAFDTARARDARQLWRPFWAMVLAAPMAAFLRGAWLGTSIFPQFIVIMGGYSALAILVWRILYWFGASRWGSSSG